MKNFFICLISFSVIMSYFSLISYGQQDRNQAITQTQQSQPQQKPILPPTVPQASSAPTPSSHIATPPVYGGIALQSQIASQGASANIQTLPTQPAVTPYGPSDLTTAYMVSPLTLNSWGKVLDIGNDNDGVGWIEVKEELFDSGNVKIKLSDPNLIVMKGNSRVRFSDIKVGDTVNVMHRREEGFSGEDIASFITIMTEEALEAMSKEMLGAENKKVEE